MWVINLMTCMWWSTWKNKKINKNSLEIYLGLYPAPQKKFLAFSGYNELEYGAAYHSCTHYFLLFCINIFSNIFSTIFT
jgi:hypothetical protein